MITHQCEDYLRVLPELKVLYPDHWKEIACDQEAVPLDMDYALYESLYHQGQLVVVTTRCDGEVVGYIMGMVKTHLHYASTLHFLTDIFYLKPSHRKGFTGINLFKKLEQVLQRRGVVKILLGTKCHLDRSRMFEYLGYQRQDIVLSKIIPLSFGSSEVLV